MSKRRWLRQLKIRANQSGNKEWKQQQRSRPMPGIQIAVAQIGQEASESQNARHHKEPPRPRLAAPQRKLRQPHIKRADGYQCSAERHPVMEHEMNDPALCYRAKLLRRYPQELHVMRQKMSRRRQKEREPA